jgi:hypothetical protein
MKRLFLDIETSMNEGRFWRTGYNLTLTPENITKERQIICIAYKWQDKKKVHCLDWNLEVPQCDKALLERIIPLLEEADQIVAHNGDRFDLPWIRGRCLVNRIPCPDIFATLDTLKGMRSKFKLNSNKLDYISKLLGGPGKMETGGFQLWHDVMDGNKSALKTMKKYCKGDVLRLEEVYLDIEPYLPVKTHVGVLNGSPRWSCPRCGSESVVSNGKVVLASGLSKTKMKCKDCGGYYRISATIDRQRLEN